MKRIDTRGLQCPAPLIATRKALKEAGTGDSFRVVTDNVTSLENISRFLRDNRVEFKVKSGGGEWIITITKSGASEALTKAEPYCTTGVPHFDRGDFIIVFASDLMGEGEVELGRLLMTNFIKAIKDLDVLPSCMVFYNSGVKLGSGDSPVVKYLEKLEKMGISLLFCTTCVDYYKLGEKIKPGTLSNMYEIAQVMASSGNIIKP
jgi:selenium metabolism protein YedF